MLQDSLAGAALISTVSTSLETHDKSISHITLVTHGDAQIIDQIYQHLNRLIDVIEVTDLSTAGTHVERELVLIKVATDNPQKRTEILQVAEVFRWAGYRHETCLPCP